MTTGTLLIIWLLQPERIMTVVVEGVQHQRLYSNSTAEELRKTEPTSYWLSPAQPTESTIELVF
ncbi:hypothetical protein Mal48_01080 [Thalassoglobus polymorphus]|uniref:Uncharacterized protein n=1 Tax=Thalassoglobus polymorphus TaxID=2527994 RepID=A0A517QGX9_9PLAN|nr:hypothetical protein Mal48_01080 [Thalassoglobus polymorphus]